MTPGAGHALRLQRCQKGRVPSESRPRFAFPPAPFLLFGERGMTPVTKERCRRVVLNQPDRLAHDPRPHAPAMQAALPIGVLRPMTDSTALRVERGLDQPEAV